MCPNLCTTGTELTPTLNNGQMCIISYWHVALLKSHSNTAKQKLALHLQFFLPFFSSLGSMAVTYSLSAPILINKSSSTARTSLSAHRVEVRASCHNISIHVSTTTTTTSPLQIGSTSRNRLVFEDKSTGVICYKDENGEITCEGYDEGPRFCQQVPKSSYKSRDEEIIELLQKCWLHIAAAAE
nr:uncharacterized protein LOC104096865 isoform X2 [Nicotiana tomentosiformis]